MLAFIENRVDVGKGVGYIGIGECESLELEI
jgi:hypothetical protein